ncbi:MAG TPA: MOSC domain-containing protein [Ferrovibrio sp.]|uniref:MOSC domain-containing protein n=1 Tax=Ferrovibrio sp. TaxID=1917215 RepID=UPI002ED31AD6
MTETTTATLARIVRFPVKGLTAQPLDQALLAPDRPLPGDRRFALAHGASAFDPAQPAYQKKGHFLTWVRNPRLAALHCSFDPAGQRITVADPEPETSDDGIDNADLTTPSGRAALEKLVLRLLGEETRGSVRVAAAPDVWFTDKQQPYISIQNAATMADLGRHLGPTHGGAPADWRRFRANLLLDGFPAWAELGWIGKRLHIGEAVLEVAETIGRCAATHVNPDTAELDEDVLGALRRQYGHTQCGVYARVVQGGTIRRGDAVGLADA